MSSPRSVSATDCGTEVSERAAARSHCRTHLVRLDVQRAEQGHDVVAAGCAEAFAVKPGSQLQAEAFAPLRNLPSMTSAALRTSSTRSARPRRNSVARWAMESAASETLFATVRNAVRRTSSALSRVRSTSAGMVMTDTPTEATTARRTSLCLSHSSRDSSAAVAASSAKSPASPGSCEAQHAYGEPTTRAQGLRPARNAAARGTSVGAFQACNVPGGAPARAPPACAPQARGRAAAPSLRTLARRTARPRGRCRWTGHAAGKQSAGTRGSARTCPPPLTAAKAPTAVPPRTRRRPRAPRRRRARWPRRRRNGPAVPPPARAAPRARVKRRPAAQAAR